MIIVPRKSVWTRQPQGPARPVAPALMYHPPVNPGPNIVTRRGIGGDFIWGADRRKYVRGSINSATTCTLFMAADVRSTIGTHRGLIGSRSNTSAAAYVQIVQRADGFFGAQTKINSSSPETFINAGALTLGYHTFVLAIGTDCRFYLDGVLVGVFARATQAPLSSHPTVVVGNYYDNTADRRFDGVVYNGGVALNTVFTPRDVQRYHDNFASVFLPRPRTTIISLGGGVTNHGLAASGINTGSPIIGTPVVTQNHAVAAIAISTSAPTLGTPALTEIGPNELVASAIATGTPSLGTPLLAQNHSITASGVVAASPILGTPSLSQNHAVTASGVNAAAPILGEPVLTEIQQGTISAAHIVTGAPILGTPALTQNHSLTAGAIACGAPVFGPVTLEQQHAMMADGFVSGAPVLGTPALSSGTSPFTREELDFLLAYMQENLMIPTASDIAAAVVAAMQTSPTPFPSNVTHFNGNPTVGSGQSNDPVRPA